MADTSKSGKSFLFSWKAKDKTGEYVSGQLRSKSRSDAIENLKKQGYFVTSVKLVSERSFSGRIKQKDIISFSGQLSTMLRAGVPLLQSLNMIASSQRKAAMANIINNLSQEVRKGSSFAKALSDAPHVFDELFISMVAAGEQSGMLEKMLSRLSVYLEKSAKLKSQVKTALIYPLSVIGIAIIVIIVMMVWVIPSFQNIFENMGAELPALTQILVNASNFIIKHGVKLAVGLAGLIFFTIRTYRSSLLLQRFFQKKIAKVPVIGKIITLAVLSRWLRTMVTMTKAGMPLVDALDFSARSADNIVVYDDTADLIRQVHSGVSLSVAMRTCSVFPELMMQFVSIGEESGRLEEMLSKVAEMYEDEVDVMVKNLSSLLEPVIIFVLGGTVAFIISAMYMPIFKMGAAVG